MKKSKNNDIQELILDIQDIYSSASYAESSLKCRLALNEFIACLDLDGDDEIVPLDLAELPGSIKQQLPKEASKALKVLLHFANDKSRKDSSLDSHDLDKIKEAGNSLISYLEGNL